MSEMKHTPGPWYIGQIITKTDHLRCFHIESETAGPIGYFDSLDDPDGPDEANARLIAAAPELLDACQQLLSLTPDYTNPEAYCRLVRHLSKAAIEKATNG